MFENHKYNTQLLCEYETDIIHIPQQGIATILYCEELLEEFITLLKTQKLHSAKHAYYTYTKEGKDDLLLNHNKIMSYHSNYIVLENTTVQELLLVLGKITQKTVFITAYDHYSDEEKILLMNKINKARKDRLYYIVLSKQAIPYTLEAAILTRNLAKLYSREKTWYVVTLEKYEDTSNFHISCEDIYYVIYLEDYANVHYGAPKKPYVGSQTMICDFISKGTDYDMIKQVEVSYCAVNNMDYVSVENREEGLLRQTRLIGIVKQEETDAEFYFEDSRKYQYLGCAQIVKQQLLYMEYQGKYYRCVQVEFKGLSYNREEYEIRTFHHAPYGSENQHKRYEMLGDFIMGHPGIIRSSMPYVYNACAAEKTAFENTIWNVLFYMEKEFSDEKECSSDMEQPSSVDYTGFMLDIMGDGAL